MSTKWIERRSTQGNSYWIEDCKVAVKKYFLDTVFYIYPTVAEAENGLGSPFGGTGFFVYIQSEAHDSMIYCYAVTNAHVIEQLRANNCHSVLRFNTKAGKLDVIEVPVDNWRLHSKGDDVAICPLPLNSQWKTKAVHADRFIITEEQVKKHSIGAGDDTITLGRYSKHSGIKQNLVTARFGHISMLPVEPVIQEDRGNYPQDSFLVETYSVSGYSGSPVFLQLDPDDRDAEERLTERKAFLLGIDWGHFDFTGEIKTDTTTGRIKAPSGMMCVVPSWKLNDLLYSNEMKKQRKSNDKVIAEQKKLSGVSLDSNLSKEKFEEVLKKVSKKTKSLKSAPPKPKTSKGVSDEST